MCKSTLDGMSKDLRTELKASVREEVTEMAIHGSNSKGRMEWAEIMLLKIIKVNLKRRVMWNSKEVECKDDKSLTGFNLFELKLNSKSAELLCQWRGNRIAHRIVEKVFNKGMKSMSQGFTLL
ncbi:hypothetical protein O3M35_005007 [Rhynocoris fuscipes]|uniref:Uncharacterized protein n=1 Tax=Rhynocoris fuscipes TaxID=488301 RepID=A0AAW1DH59_9HEMI